MRGRRPTGPKFVEQVDGSAQAKQRVRIVLETMVEGRPVKEACAHLGICGQRFGQLRHQTVQWAVYGMESKPRGRPRRQGTVTQAEVEALRRRVAELEAELRAAQVREEIALILPRAVRAGTEKKTPGRKPR